MFSWLVNSCCLLLINEMVDMGVVNICEVRVVKWLSLFCFF